ncbi:zinc ABC transporter substrate-binding protein, partial [Salmonella enterica subsp. enterica serovar Anatum]|nr:zinc ABC transporter substrate-binding protein [Salmonella enterica subsp. enterica serovar Anatum]
HAWMSAENALIYVDNIRDALVKYDPDNAQIYKQNAERYKAKIPRQQKLIASSPTLQQAWNLVQEACITQNPLQLGEAATLSAIA